MAKSGRTIKLSKNYRPFISRVQRDGAVQKAFKNDIGTPTGKCVETAMATIKPTSGAAIRAIVKKCSAKIIGTGKTLTGNFAHGKEAQEKKRKDKYAEIKAAKAKIREMTV